jgi:DNA-binding transcriptional MerR regulator
MDKAPAPIPAKRYFTIGEVGELCGVKPHVLRYWEQEFAQLRPMKRRGNRRYYQHHEVIMIRRIRELLYDQGFTISGARNKIQEQGGHELDPKQHDGGVLDAAEAAVQATGALSDADLESLMPVASRMPLGLDLRHELLAIKGLLDGDV